jgi:hypothetical protein
MADIKQSIEGQDESNTSHAISRDEIVQLVSQVVNSAISQRNTAFEKKMETMLSKLVPQQAVETEEAIKPGRVPNVELMSMKKQLDAMAAEKQAEISRRRETELKNTVKDQLTKAGVSPKLIKAAMATLISEDKLISYTADEYADNKDRIVFKSPSGEEDLVSGLGKYLKSEEGSSFLSPRGTQGSGDRNYNSSSNKNQKQEVSDDAIVNMITNAFGSF